MTRQPPSSPHFSNSLRPALRFRRGSYGVGRRKRIGAYGCAARRRRCPPKCNPKGRLKKPTGCVAALVPRTRSSHNVAASLIANFGFKRGTRSIDIASVPLVPKFASAPAAMLCELRNRDTRPMTHIARRAASALSASSTGAGSIECEKCGLAPILRRQALVDQPAFNDVGDRAVVLVHHQHVRIALDADFRQVDDVDLAAGGAHGRR